MVTERGVATVQAFVDSSGLARGLIRSGLSGGVDPSQILADVQANDPAAETHQYCIVGVDGTPTTYAGTSAASFAWVGGRTGQVGSLKYCVAGNLLAGEQVVADAEAAIVQTPGSLAERLIAAMEAARDNGGDGRCSCSNADPTGCGSPPPSFALSAINGYLVVARSGDTPTCSQCSGGSYWLDEAVTFASGAGGDPVTLLRGQYDAFVQSVQGRTDAIASDADLFPAAIEPDGFSQAQLTVVLRDIDGDPVGSPAATFEVSGDGLTSIATPQSSGDGEYLVGVTAGATSGVERLRVTADDVILMPPAPLSLGVPGAVSALRFTSESRIEWDPAIAAVRYAPFRGALESIDCSHFGACAAALDADTTDTVWDDAAVPANDQAFFYLVAAVEDGGAQGSLGESDCTARVVDNRLSLKQIERTGEVVPQILHVLESDRQAQQAVTDPGRASCRGRHRRVAHRRRVADQALDAAERFGEREVTERLADLGETRGFGVQLEPEHRAEAALLTPRECVAGMVGEPGVVDAAHGRVGRQLDRQCFGVGLLPFDASDERAKPALGQPRVVRRAGETEAVGLEVDPFGEGLGRGDYRAADHVAVTVDQLRRRVDDQIGAQRDRLLQHRREEGVVDDEQCLAVERCAYRRQIDQSQQRVARRFDPDQRRGILGEPCDRRRFGQIGPLDLDQATLVEAAQQAVRAAVAIATGDDPCTERDEL